MKKCNHCLQEKDEEEFNWRKYLAVSQMVGGGYPIETIQTEIDRCIVLCSNCHEKLTMKQRGWFRGRK